MELKSDGVTSVAGVEGTGRLGRIAAAAFLIIAVGVFSVRAIAKSSGGLWDFNIYAAASRAWVAGTNPYDEAALRRQWGPSTGQMDISVQRSIAPPTLLLVLAPFAVLPIRAASWLWTAVGAGLIVAAALALARLLGDSIRSPRAWVYLGCVLLLGPLHSGVRVGQPAVPAAACVVLAVAALHRRKAVAAGVLLALATAIKLQLGAPVILYLLLRREWKASAAACIGFALIAALAVGRLELARQDWAGDWVQNMRQSMTAGAHNDFVTENRTRDHLLNLQLPFYALTGSRNVANALAWATAAILLCVYLASLPRQRSAQMRADDHILHFGIILILLLLPVYHRYYDATLAMVPLAWALARMPAQAPARAWQDGRWARWACLILLAPLALPVGWATNLITRGYVPSSVQGQAWWNNIIMCEQAWLLLLLAIILLAALSLTRTRGRPAPPHQAAQPAGV